MSHSKTFREFRFWPKHVIQLQKNKNIYTYKKYCAARNIKVYNDDIKNELNKNLVSLCFNLYLNRLNKNSHKNLKFHRAEKAYMKKFSKQIISPRNFDALENLLRNLRPNIKSHILYSNLLSGYYMDQKIIPPNQLLKLMHITPTFTRYIQTKEIEEFSTQYVFYSELKELKKKAFDILDKGADDSEVRESFERTLNYLNLTYDHQPKRKALLTLLSISKSLMRRGYFRLAEQGLNRILQQRKYHFEASVFNLMWTRVLQKKYSSAIQVIADQKLDDHFLDRNSKIKFWMGHIYEKMGESQKAHSIYASILKKDPLSFYAILSAKIMGDDNSKSTKEVYLAGLNSEVNYRKISSKTIDKRWLKRISLWSEVGLPRFLTLEIKNLHRNKKIETQDHILMAAYYLSKQSEYLDSFKIIYKSIRSKKIRLTENTIKILFPRPYLKQIQKNTKSFDPVIALSLIRQESGFNHRARSHVGARGLMQLMPATARQFKRRLKTKHLYNPNLNIRIGSKYFKNLLKRYENNLVYSLAAYNAGESRVDRWQKNYLNSDSILENIENIPFQETRKYVKLIFRNIFFYKMIFNNDIESSPDLNRIYDIHLGFKG